MSRLTSSRSENAYSVLFPLFLKMFLLVSKKKNLKNWIKVVKYVLNEIFVNLITDI